VKHKRYPTVRSSREAQQLRKMMVNAVATQTLVHHREVTALVVKLTVAEEALRDAIRLLDATRRNEWTPADTKRLEEIRATANA
jgi:hypothetical protein